MKRQAALLIASYLLGSTLAFGQGAPANPRAETVAPNIPGVVAGGTKVQFIKDGFKGTEGPVAAPDGSLLFTENDASRIVKIDKDGNVSVYLENTNGAAALAFDTRGRLVAAQRTNPLIGSLGPAPIVLAAAFEGLQLLQPNDLVADKKGGVYFTDPGPNVQPGQPQLPRKPAVFYIKPDGTLIKVAEDIERPNGIQLSPDEKVLYVNNSNGCCVLAFDVQPDGTVRNRRDFLRVHGPTGAEGVTRSGADGAAVDAAGRIYLATPIGIQVFTPQAQHLGTIPMPIRPQNLAFAGPDKKTLYVVGEGAAYKIDMLAQGHKERAK